MSSRCFSSGQEMANILIDDKSHQAKRHLGTDNIGTFKDARLRGFIVTLKSLGHFVSFTSLDTEAIHQDDILLIASRGPHIGFNRPELSKIESHVENRGSLWLMANHGGKNGGFVSSQNQVAKHLALPWYYENTNRSLMRDSQPFDYILSHPVCKDLEDGELRIRNSCDITLHNNPLVMPLVRYRNKETCFAVAIEQDNQARIIGTADSGFISSLDDCGYDMINKGMNQRFVANAINWLIHR